MFQKKLWSLLCIIFSIILSNIDKREIGLKLFKSCVEDKVQNSGTLRKKNCDTLKK